MDNYPSIESLALIHEQRQVVSLAIQNSNALYPSYMSCVNGGALFVPSSREHFLGEKCLILLKLIDEQTTFEIQGKVVWLTPKRAQGNRVPGIGLEFQGKAAMQLNNSLQLYLNTLLTSDKPTHTV